MRVLVTGGAGYVGFAHKLGSCCNQIEEGLTVASLTPEGGRVRSVDDLLQYIDNFENRAVEVLGYVATIHCARRQHFSVEVPNRSLWRCACLHRHCHGIFTLQ